MNLAATAETAPVVDNAALRQGIDPASTAEPARAASITDAWKATVAKTGPVTWPEEPKSEALQAAEAALEARKTETEGEEKPEEAAAEKPPKPAKKAKAEVAPVEETEEEEAPEEETVSAKDHIKARKDYRERYERRERAQTQRHQQQVNFVRGEMAKVEHARQALSPLLRAGQMLEAGDFDGFAKGIGEALGNAEMKDWNTLNSEALKAVQSPVYKKMRDLERQAEQDRQERARAAEEQRAAYTNQEQARAIEDHKRGIVTELSDDEDPFIAALFEKRPAIAEQVYAIQKSHHDSRGEVPPSRDATLEFLRNVHSELQFYNDLIESHADSDVVKKLRAKPGGRQGTKTPEGSNAGPQKTATSERRTQKPAPKNVPQSATAQAAAIPAMTDAEKFKYYGRLIEEDFSKMR